MKPYPVIIVPGIGQSRTRLAENGKMAWPLDVDTEKLKKTVLPSAVRMALLRHDCGFENALRTALCEALEPLHGTDTGEPVHAVRTETFEQSIAECTDEQRRFLSRMVPYSVFARTVGEENLYYFAYNPMGDVAQTVQDLRAFTLRVLEKTGAEKVSFIAISLGGSILTQYLDRYVECGDTARVVGIVAAFDGSRVLSGIFQNNFSEHGMAAMAQLLLGNRQAETLQKLVRLIPRRLAKRYADAVTECLMAVLCRSTIMWGTIPAALYPEIRDRYLIDARFDELRTRTEQAYRVRADFPSLVQKCAQYGVDVYSLYGCGLHLLAVNDDADSDGVVHTASCRMGEDSPIADHARAFPGMAHEDAAKQKTLLALCAELLCTDVEDIHIFDKEADIS